MGCIVHFRLDPRGQRDSAATKFIKPFSFIHLGVFFVTLSRAKKGRNSDVARIRRGLGGDQQPPNHPVTVVYPCGTSDKLEALFYFRICMTETSRDSLIPDEPTEQPRSMHAFEYQLPVNVAKYEN